jgi:peptidoglycan-associated lipoprotein
MMQIRKSWFCLITIVCLMGLGVGCHKMKGRVEPITTPELSERDTQSVQVQTGESSPATARDDLAETESEQSFTSKNYPGIEGEFLESSLLKDVYFNFDRSDLSSKAYETLSENARLLRKFSQVKIQIEGHCDERGSTSYNLALGEKRAAAVRNYLISLGISPERLSTISYGEEMPADPEHHEGAWAKNRRSHMIIYDASDRANPMSHLESFEAR